MTTQTDDEPERGSDEPRGSFVPAPPPREEDPPTHPATRWLIIGVLVAMLAGLVAFGIMQSQQPVSPLGDVSLRRRSRPTLPTPPDLVESEPVLLVEELDETSLLTTLLGGRLPSLDEAVQQVCSQSAQRCELARSIAFDPHFSPAEYAFAGPEDGWIQWLDQVRACLGGADCVFRPEAYPDVSRDSVERTAFVAVGLRLQIERELNTRADAAAGGYAEAALWLQLHAAVHEFGVGQESRGKEIATHAMSGVDVHQRPQRDIGRIARDLVVSDDDPFIRAGLLIPVHQRSTRLRSIFGTPEHTAAMRRIEAADGDAVRGTIEVALGLGAPRIESVFGLRSLSRRAVGIWRPDLAEQACADLSPLVATPSKRPSEAHRVFANAILAHRVFCGPNPRHDALLVNANEGFAANEHAVLFAVLDLSAE